MAYLRARRAECGDPEPHEPHQYLRGRPSDPADCGGLSAQAVALAAMQARLDELVREWHGRAPEGVTLLLHPQVRYVAQRESEPPGYGQFVSPEPLAFTPPEIPVIYTADMRKGEWRLARIEPLEGGVFPA